MSLALLAGIVGCGGDSASESSEDKPSQSTPTPKSECDAKGINEAEGRTGRCTDDNGVTRIVVERRDTLKIDDARVKLVKTYTEKSVSSEAADTVKAKGRFVIFQFRVTNTTHRPLQWAPGIGATALRLGEDVFSPDDTTAAYSKALQVKGDPGTTSTEIQPGQPADGWAAFDVPVNKVALLNRRGSELLVVSAENAVNGYNASSGEADVQGTIQLWR